MKRFLKSKVLVLVMLVALTAATINCGVLMHPERNGKKGGKIDTTALVLDCLWLIVGVVPGVVALVVDFATGGIYGPGMAMNVTPGREFAFRLPGPAPTDAEVAVTLESPDGNAVSLLDRKVAQGEEIGLMNFALPTKLADGKYFMSLTVNDVPTAEWGLNVASAKN